MDGKVTVITVSSREIGRAKVVIFVRDRGESGGKGADRKNGDFHILGSAETAVNRIHADGGQAINIHCDMTQKEEIQVLFDQIVGHFGRLDKLVNNTAALNPGKFEEIQTRYWGLIRRINI